MTDSLGNCDDWNAASRFQSIESGSLDSLPHIRDAMLLPRSVGADDWQRVSWRDAGAKAESRSGGLPSKPSAVHDRLHFRGDWQ